MKNPLLAALAVAFTFAFMQTATAQDETGRFYLGAGVGQAEVDNLCDPGDADFVSTSCDDKDTGVKLYGGYHFHKNFSVEGGYVDFGEATESFGPAPSAGAGVVASTNKHELSSFFAAAVGKIHVHPKVTLFGKVGMHRWDWKVEDLSDDAVDPFYGAGAEAAPFPNERIKLRVEYEMFKSDDVNDSGIDFDTQLISAGINYTF